MNNLVSKLAAVIDPARISTDATRLDDLSWDALSEGRIHPRHRPQLAAPLCAVTPVSTEEVQGVVRFHF